SFALGDCASVLSIEHAARALPAIAVTAVFRRKSRREPFLANSATGIFTWSFVDMELPLE
ncbi:MAG TPA: hypothetical protein VNN25_04515, partial [Thermoanaerobaculia bacterium]|nr:hypothetical protein [Thermoanaerobaculia bacterium]